MFENLVVEDVELELRMTKGKDQVLEDVQQL